MPVTLLVSYPKSGNTWTRILLSNYFREDNGPADLNSLMGSPIHLGKELFDETMGIASSDLRQDEIDKYRPEFHRMLFDGAKRNSYIKVHDAYRVSSNKPPLFPANKNCRVIYLVRNPLDIVPSFAHHDSLPLDTIIRLMSKQDTRTFGGATSFGEIFSSWSHHVTGWTEQKTFETLTVRYEDILADPYSKFAEMITFSENKLDSARLRQAVDISRFEKVRDQESRHGFRERQPGADRFFRNGREGSWKVELSAGQASRIVADHGQVMDQFGYDANR